MSYQGDYSASLFDQAAPSTWPPEPADGYLPGQWWYVDAPGDVDGTAVEVGDHLYPIGVGRRWGELAYGDEVYGGPIDPPWPAESARVMWRVVANSAPAWDRPAPPYAGCPLVAGYRIVIEALLDADPLARTYGSGTYGSGTYGQAAGYGTGWRDVTSPTAGVVIRRGAADGSPIVDIDEADLEVVDVDGTWLPLTTPATADTVTVGTMMRVSVVREADGEARAMFTGRIDTITDRHERGARVVAVTAYGLAADLTTTADIDRPAEAAADRIEALLAQAGWRWGVGDTYPDRETELRRTDLLEQATLRDEVDRAAVSACWHWWCDARGVSQVGRWPLVASGVGLEVTDCKGRQALASPGITLTADAVELLNIASVNSAAVQGATEITVEVTDPPSINRAGRRSEALGFPMSGLSSDAAGTRRIADAALARYSRVIHRAGDVEADSGTDGRWPAALFDLELGTPIAVHRTQPVNATARLEGLVCGLEHRLMPGHWASTLFTTTTTTTI